MFFFSSSLQACQGEIGENPTYLRVCARAFDSQSHCSGKMQCSRILGIVPIDKKLILYNKNDLTAGIASAVTSCQTYMKKFLILGLDEASGTQSPGDV
jgi:hypothetical protein